MPTTKHRVAVTLDDDDYVFICQTAREYGKSASWVVAHVVRWARKGNANSVNVGIVRQFSARDRKRDSTSKGGDFDQEGAGRA
jgi:hypothetical protein